MKTYLTIILFFLTFLAKTQTCGAGGIMLSSQDEINDFATDYPGCTSILGSLSISGSDINDLSPLSVLTSIGGSLEIYGNINLYNITGLNNLSGPITGNIRFSNNGITNFTG